MKRLVLLIFLLQLSLSAQSQTWQFVGDLAPEQGRSEDYGIGVLLDGDRLFAGWPHLFGTPEPALQCGEIEILSRAADGQFQPEAMLRAPNCKPADAFGLGIFKVEDGLLAVTAPSGIAFSGVGNAADSRVYLFQEDPSFTGEQGFNVGWRPVAEIIGSRVGGNQAMGAKVVSNGNLMLIQAQEYDSIFGVNFARSNGVYVFERNTAGDWIEVQFVTENADFFGLDFELAGNQLLVGAPEAQTFGAAGRVFVYEWLNGQFQQIDVLRVNSGGNFGFSMHVSGDRAVIGGVNLAQDGAVWIFDRDNNGQWQQGQKIQNPMPADNDIYGIFARLLGNELYVGAENGVRQTPTGQGTVFVYRDDGDGYALIENIESPVMTSENDPFGAVFEVSNNDIFIKDLGSPVGGSTGLFHFQREGSTSQTYTINSQISGTWFNSQRSGEGFLLDYLPSGDVVAFWFTFDQDGNQMWLVGQGRPNGGMLVIDDLQITSGGRFGDSFNANDVQRQTWGSVSFDFSSCNGAVVDYSSDIGFGSGQISLSQLSGISGVDCDTSTPAAKVDLGNGASGAYFNAMRDGEGFQVQVANQGNTEAAVVYWFTYDDQGNQAWFVGLGDLGDESIGITRLLRPVGASFGSAFNSEDIVLIESGALDLNFSNCDDLNVNFQSVLSGFESIMLAETRLYQTAGTSCTP